MKRKNNQNRRQARSDNVIRIVYVRYQQVSINGAYNAHSKNVVHIYRYWCSFTCVCILRTVLDAWSYMWVIKPSRSAVQSQRTQHKVASCKCNDVSTFNHILRQFLGAWPWCQKQVPDINTSTTRDGLEQWMIIHLPFDGLPLFFRGLTGLGS